MQQSSGASYEKNLKKQQKWHYIKNSKTSRISCVSFDTLRDQFVCPPIHLVTGLISSAVCRVGEMFQHVKFCVFLHRVQVRVTRTTTKKQQINK